MSTCDFIRNSPLQLGRDKLISILEYTALVDLFLK
jgi:hypothetical protein